MSKAKKSQFPSGKFAKWISQSIGALENYRIFDLCWRTRDFLEAEKNSPDILSCTRAGGKLSRAIAFLKDGEVEDVNIVSGRCGLSLTSIHVVSKE